MPSTARAAPQPGSQARVRCSVPRDRSHPGPTALALATPSTRLRKAGPNQDGPVEPKLPALRAEGAERGRASDALCRNNILSPRTVAPGHA